MATKTWENNQESHYCPNCNAVLGEQLGFNAKDDYWTCTKCGQLLYGEVYEGEKYPSVMWFCNQCKELLNKQEGFRDCLDGWTCVKCGYHEDFTVAIEASKDDIGFKKKVVDAFQKSKPILKKAAKWTFGIGVAVGTALVAIALAKPEKDNENSEDGSDNDASAYTPPKKSYQGYIPSGCRACGGPYPLCKGGCPAFDD